jgi:nucleotide-binding universal stress UspA family protein
VVGSAVVGVDGAPASRAARAWAGDVARDVREVHIDEGDVAVGIERAADECDADLVVVGMHEQRRRILRGLGPVVGSLLERTTRPLAIVGEAHIDVGADGADGAVVVGVGHGPATQAALQWAADWARIRTAPLELVRAVPQRPVFRSDGLLDLMAFYIDPTMATGWAADDLAAFAEEVDAATGAEVPVGWSVPAGSPGAVLVEATDRAQLLVVGLHDRPGHDDHEVPAWCRHVLLHAPCPVVFVPA